MDKSSKGHIAKAHDHFFRMAMADKRVAREFFEVHLPEDLLNIVELDHLELQSGTYIDDMRKESIADTLFKTVINGHDAFLYLVVDHQSQPDELMPFRVLKYVCNIIDQHTKDKKSNRIPLILPLVVYHGTRPWTYSTNINALVDAPKELVEAYFLKPFILIDLNLIEDAVLKQRAWVGVMELTLKHIVARNMLPFIPDIIGLLKHIEQSNGKEFAEIVLIYILDRGELGNKKAFVDMVKSELAPEVGGKMTTIAEQFRDEGRQEGIQQGRQEGFRKAAMALIMLTKGASVAAVAKQTELTIDEIKALEKQVLPIDA